EISPKTLMPSASDVSQGWETPWNALSLSSGPARGVLLVASSQQSGGRDDGPGAEGGATTEERADLRLVVVLGQLGALPQGEVGPAGQQQAAHAAVEACARHLVALNAGAIAGCAP